MICRRKQKTGGARANTRGPGPAGLDQKSTLRGLSGKSGAGARQTEDASRPPGASARAIQSACTESAAACKARNHCGYPVVSTGGRYSASFDGLTMLEDAAFAHKSLNVALREVMSEGCNGADLPRQYQVQMEQQAKRIARTGARG